MKKLINITILIFLLLSFICNNSYATTITLEQIVEKFNKSSFVNQNNDLGQSIRAINDNGNIIITITTDGQTENIEYLVKGNILSIEIDDKEEKAFLKTYITLELIDSIGQLHGYQEGELLKTLSSDETENYNLEKEGYEIKKTSNNEFKIETDITKKIPLLDFSDTYIEVADLQDFKEVLAGDGFCEKSKGNIWFNKKGYNGENTLLIAEKGKITEKTYKSILSILEVMFENDKVIEKFKENYPSILTGDKEFEGFSIKVNPKEKTEWEEKLIPSNSDYQFVRIIVDKQLAISNINDGSKLEGGTSNKDNTQIQKQNKLDADKLPNTGVKEVNIFLIVLYIIVFNCFIALIYIFFNKKKIR